MTDYNNNNNSGVNASGHLNTLSSEPLITKEGMLRKKGSRANLWGERYFVLRGPSLFYFLKPENVVSIFFLSLSCLPISLINLRTLEIGTKRCFYLTINL